MNDKVATHGDSSHELTQSLEDYLETIYELRQSKTVVRCSDIADRLAVRRPSVTSALRSLSEKGLIIYEPYTPITLTDAGEKESLKIIRRHKAMEIFLERILGVDGHESKESACLLEHAMNDEVTTRLVEFVEFVDSCPRIGASLFRRSEYHCREKNNDQYCAMCIHGCLDEMVHSGRTVDLSSVHRESKSLKSLSRDHETFIFVRLGDELLERPEFSPTYWRPLRTLHLVEKPDENATHLTVALDNKTFVVDMAEADKIEVLPCE
ncbi:MAG: metal-dependent transcriptional regulator [Planctomycetia bacterium]|nr:metal-dependent transcriptional regulator [Planctomycetia bacterium]